MGHDTEHITDPQVFRLRVSTTPRAVVFAWDYPGATLLQVRIQRSRTGFAGEPHQSGDPDARDDRQEIVHDGATGSFRDSEVEPGKRYFYTVWARPRAGAVDRVDSRGDTESGDDAGPRSHASTEPGSPGDAAHSAERNGGWTLWARKKVRAGRAPRLRRRWARLLGRL